MTRLAILADIHGNLPALDAVIADLPPDVDQIIVAGDVINWGPFSAAAVDRVTSAGWAVIRGNNEYYLLDYQTPRAPAHWDEFRLIPWLHLQLNGPRHRRIAAWPDTLSLRYPDGPPVLVCHATPRSPWVGMFPAQPECEILPHLDGVAEPVIIAAHTHLAMDRQIGRWRVLNPGTVGVPLDGASGARYLILDATGDGWEPAFRCVEYDQAALFDGFDRQRIVEECGVTGRLVIEEFERSRLRVLPFHQWHTAHYPGEPWTEAQLARFTDTDCWAHTPEPYRIPQAHATV